MDFIAFLHQPGLEHSPDIRIVIGD